MKVGILGGTFDPIHTGHLIGAEQAREGAGLDEVWFMPNRIPPHKDNTSGASPAQRLKMVELAVESHPAFRADDTEIGKEGISYTYDTVKLLKARYPAHDLYFIIGADMINYLPKWHRIEGLLPLIRFIGLQRQGVKIQRSEWPSEWKPSIQLVSMPPIGISSTDIRQRRSMGRSIRFLVPNPVKDYIEENGLYEK